MVYLRSLAGIVVLPLAFSTWAAAQPDQRKKRPLPPLEQSTPEVRQKGLSENPPRPNAADAAASRGWEPTFVSPTGLRCAMDLYFNGADLETDLSEFTVRTPKVPIRRLKQALHDAAAKVDFSRVLGDNPLGWSPEKTEAADRQALTHAISRIRFRGME